MQARSKNRLSADLDHVILKALRKEPERRYASAEQFAEDIRRFMHGLPVMAAQGSWNYRAQKFAERHKLGILATAVVVFAIVGGVVATVREARVARESERRAEKRFDDLRGLSDWLIFQVHDSIRDLPGATPVRKVIVQKSLEYLSQLAQDSVGNIPLQRQLASAYEKIGLVQGDPEGSNLGDIAGAFDSFARALNIRKAIASSRENNVADAIALSGSYRELCALEARYMGNMGLALEYCNNALKVAEHLYRTAPQNRDVQLELAKVHSATGTVYGQGSTSGNAGNSYEALQDHRQALLLVEELARGEPENQELACWQGRLDILTADDLFETGHVSQAIPLYQQAAVILETLTRKTNSPTYAAFLDLAYQRLGDMLLVSGHYEESVAFYRKQLEIDQQLVTADPKNMLFRTSLAAAYATYGHGLWRSGHVQAGLAAFRKGFAEIAQSKQVDSRARGLEATLWIWMAGALAKSGDQAGALHSYLLAKTFHEDICRSDPKNVEECLDLAGVENSMARIYLQQGKVEEALADYERAISISEPLSFGVQPNLESLYTLVNSYYGMGDVYVAMAHRSKETGERTRFWKQASSLYEKSHAAFLRIPEWRPITPNEYDAQNPRQIEQRQLLCRSMLQRSVSSTEEAQASPLP